jgi:hypothetical protein
VCRTGPSCFISVQDILARYDGKLPAHFRLSPSGSSRWLHCSYSARTDLPESQNKAADKGRVLHLQAAMLLTAGKPLSAEAALPAVVVQYVNFVLSLAGELLVETQLVSQTIFDLGGTLDALRVTEPELHVVDLKTGKELVPVAGNTQMQTYLVLARERFPQQKRFRATIVQDQGGQFIHTTEFTAAEIDAHRSAIIRASVNRDRHAGPWCDAKYCPLRPSCPDFAAIQR